MMAWIDRARTVCVERLDDQNLTCRKNVAVRVVDCKVVQGRLTQITEFSPRTGRWMVDLRCIVVMPSVIRRITFAVLEWVPAQRQDLRRLAE
jgi:hypothetical protein